MNETQKTISEWGIQTFGYPTRERSVDRMLEECKELKDVREANNFGNDFSYDRIVDECADIYITMCQVMTTFGFDLHACVDHKMQINRGREWKIAGDGTGQHIKEVISCSICHGTGILQGGLDRPSVACGYCHGRGVI